MTTATEHDLWIREAIALARAAREKGNHPFGSVLVVGGEIVARGENSTVVDGDPTRHAELSLLQQAWSRLSRAQIESATLYSSTEPCPMCTGAIFHSRVPRVVFSVSQGTLSGLTGSRFFLSCTFLLGQRDRQVEVVGPVLEDEGLRVHEGFWPV